MGRMNNTGPPDREDRREEGERAGARARSREREREREARSRGTRDYEGQAK